MKRFLWIQIVLTMVMAISAKAQFQMDSHTMSPLWKLNGNKLLTTPEEGLWSIATEWQQDWMGGWKHARPEKMEQSGEWMIVSGKMVFPQGTLLLRDAYREEDGKVRCRRRYEWQGKDTLPHVNLSVRFRLKGERMQAFMPGILYYGNKNGAKVNPNVIPVYSGTPGEFAVFEDHRFPMPFAMLENTAEKYAAALHTTPSPVRGAVLDDQWWSMGVEAGDVYTDFVLYSGPIGYNRKHGVAKALQFSSMPYTQTYIDMEPGRVIEKEFCLELYEIEREGTGFQRPLYTSLDLYKPYDAETGMFPVGFNGKEFYGGDPVSCGQAMYNFAKAIVQARKTKRFKIGKWETFLRKCCDGQSRRILKGDWNPHSTAEAFLIAPLAIASDLFGETAYRQAAEKAAKTFAERHLKMNGCYWGGTLDATCEDKEGAWAAFQGFLELYELEHTDEYLQWAKHAMDVCLSYVVVWDIPLPAGRMADYHFRTTGWTVVSPQNQHIDVYGVLFAPEVYKMGIYLKDDRLKKLAKVMYRSCFQLTNAYGAQGEQLQQTNFAQHGDMSNVHKLRGGYSEGWTVFWITAHFLNAAAKFKEMKVEL